MNKTPCDSETQSRPCQTPRVVPSGLGMPGPLAGFCARCGCGAVCKEDKAAADRTYSRTAASPGHAPGRSKPEDKNQITSKLTYLKHVSLEDREQSSVERHCEEVCVFTKHLSSLQAKEGKSDSSQRKQSQKQSKCKGICINFKYILQYYTHTVFCSCLFDYRSDNRITLDLKMQHTFLCSHCQIKK